MILCTTDSLLHQEFDLADLGERFVRWMNDGLWTATAEVFDVGGTTSTALCRIAKGARADQAGGQLEDNNGNGSLMRILPVVLRFASEPIESFATRVEKVSAITHGHARAKMACMFYGLMIRHLLRGQSSAAALTSARAEFTHAYGHTPEFAQFRHIVEDDLTSLPEREVVSTGYVLHTLHASLWCLVRTQNFHDCVLKAVNLGGDTDTTGCVAGGLAGVAHGMKSIPADWIAQLPRQEDLSHLFHQFTSLCAEAAPVG
jgi:ADP-ribosylglycohydrolase